MTLLSVNVNKIATLRNSRGGNNPDVLKTALDIIRFGAHGITVHPRPDGRHIRTDDVIALKKNIDVELNIEGYPSTDFIQLVEQTRPAQCTLVPDPPEVLTSNAGWKIKEHQEFLQDVVGELKSFGCRVSLFFDPYDHKSDELLIAKNFIGADRIELYTEMYAKAFATAQQSEVLSIYVKAAQVANRLGLGVNAGHDLDLNNLATLIKAMPFINEVSIGHALICDALYLGMQETVGRYLRALQPN